VIAVLGGLGAAVCWGVGTLSAARAARLVGAPRVLAWVMLVGLVAILPFVAATGIPDALTGRRLVWFVVAGAANVAGLLLAYSAMRAGKVAIVAPITSTEGALAALLAVAAGESLRIVSGIALAGIALGVVMASRTRSDRAAHPPRATFLAIGAAASFGLGLYATGRISTALPLVWALLSPRLVGVVVMTAPALARRRLGIPAAVLPFVVFCGLCEVGGFASYAIGARHSIAISAVLASQFAAIAAVAAFLLFRERLTRVQTAGVVVVAVGVALLSLLQA
jgi:drug/metabolite transporter (DMT)-like permease